jgi:hypothetical protein
MAPIAKENDAATLSSPAGNAADLARTQPVALEIPVSVNGARTIEGSDKREPFSENTQSVLGFYQWRGDSAGLAAGVGTACFPDQ